MELEITVRAKGEYWNGGATTFVPEPFKWCFEPLRTADDPIMCLANNEKMFESAAMNKVLKVREEAAKEIAEELTRMLMSEMRKRDTHNGYK